jgi:hypothetical protein
MWTREESLANIVAVKFIDLGERQVEETRQILADENIAQRLTRQLVELKVSVDRPGVPPLPRY